MYFIALYTGQYLIWVGSFASAGLGDFTSLSKFAPTLRGQDIVLALPLAFVKAFGSHP